MALELYSGTQAVDGTEWSMTTDSAGPDADTTAGRYQPVVDAINLAAGDVYQIALYEKARAADTQRLAQVWILTGAQASPLWIGPEVTLMHGWDFTLKKLAGSDRTITWSIRDTVAGALVSANIPASGIGATSISAAGLNAIADAKLDRNMATGTDSGTDSTAVRTERQALRVLRNKTTIAAGVATVMKEDDATPSWTAAVTTAAGNPISGVDPT